VFCNLFSWDKKTLRYIKLFFCANKMLYNSTNNVFQATYEEAKAMCNSKGMDMVSMETEAESDSIANFFESAGLSSLPFFSSLKKGAESTFQWQSGLAADFLNWAPNQPAKNGGDCTAMFNLLLQSQSCDQKLNFMCEAKKYSHFPNVHKY